MKRFLFGLTALTMTTFSFVTIDKAQAASDTAQALAVVTAAINIAQVADLDFGSAVQGDAQSTVAPADASAAEFTVTGQPSTAYTITLPSDGTIEMITGAGGSADERIAVDSFTSTPAAGANGSLDGTGSETLKVGATRAALSATQVAGNYAATFTVDVVY
ncbi:DUF4402 domain-containing protein [Bacteriovorax sp. Seq25_V]|uniref:DUF4402 domain-containing protein n=1 Tax=Bacteriovorax sp. Seq25_V TaxID=1201288 RepID=UPI00038A3905|nr:DUF4402 domain-containing protein [Bacteriovorax sp. Seq25_V]EQC47338.1 PF14352 domain protein [Bacteriovorax sp. Seq25_V]